MKLIDIRKVDRAELPNKDFLEAFDRIKEDTENFNKDLLELYEDEVTEFLKVVQKYKPEAIKTRVVRKTPEKQPKQPVIDFEADDVVEQVMKDYNLTKAKAESLIALREEAFELKKENLNKLLDRLDKSEFYQGRNYQSKAPIDNGRSRDLGKDSKQGSITSAEERKMTGKPFKRISKAGRKNQYGTTEGGKVYYEYRMNRRDVDNKIKLAKGGGIGNFFKNLFSKKPVKIDGKYTGQTMYAYGDEVLIGKIISKNDKNIDVYELLENGQPFGSASTIIIETALEEYKTRGVFGSFVVEIWEDGKMLVEEVVRGGYSKLVKEMAEEYAMELRPNSYEDLTIKVRKLENVMYKTGGGVGIPNADKMFHLPYEIAVYVPSTKDVDKSITASELRARVKEVETYLAETFGGFTASEKVGGYLSSKSGVVTEKVVPVTSFSSMEDFRKNKSKLVNKMSVWAKKWGQEAIGFEFEGDLYYVPQKFKKGGTLRATYIPNRDIKSLTTIWGNNIQGKDLIDGAYTKRKNIKSAPKVTRGFVDDEAYEYEKGGKAPEKSRLVPPKDIQLSTTELPFPIYTYLPNVRYELNQEYKDNLKKLSNSEFIEYLNTAQRLKVDGYAKKFYHVGWNDNGRGYAVNLQNALRCKKYLEKLGYKVAIGQNNFRFDPEKPVLAQQDFYDVYTDTILPLNTYKDLVGVGIMRPDAFETGGKTKPKAPEPTVVRGFYDDEPYEYAKGGGIEHGLKDGDEILKIEGNLITVLPKGSDKSSPTIQYDIVNISNGKRINAMAFYSMKESLRKKWWK